jgi:hypothetical protein
MGYQKVEPERYALVSMTNKDVYHVTRQTAKELMALMAEPEKHPASYETTDAKSRSEIAITIANISSVVIPEGFKQLGGRHANR